MNAILTVFWGLVVLLFLVVIHELGHFLAARSFKVRVTEFMIGMPGPNISFERNGCKYGITCIPLGGYNRITGMEGGPENPHLSKVLEYVYKQGKVDVEHTACACSLSEEDAQEALIILDGWGSIRKEDKGSTDPLYYAPKTSEYDYGQARTVKDKKALLDSERKQTYRGLNFWRRLVVLFAGPLTNIVAALLVFVILFSCIGVSYATNTVDYTIDDSPAAKYLQHGDVIKKANSKEISSIADLSTVLSSLKDGENVQLLVDRDGEMKKFTITPTKDSSGTYKLGFYVTLGKYRMSVVDSLKLSGTLTVETIKAYARLFNPTTMSETVSESSSVVGISVMAKQAADTGAFNLFYLIAVVSLSLGVVNLVPVPPLDGGKILVEIIQVVIRREISAKAINAISYIVMALLLLLFIFLLRQDIINFILK